MTTEPDTEPSDKSTHAPVISGVVGGLLAWIIAWVIFRCAARDLSHRLLALQLSSRLHDLQCVYIPTTAALLGAGVGLAIWLLCRSRRMRLDETKGGVEFLVNAGVPLAAGAFFLYQVMAGSFFATTTVTVKATRCNGKILVLATLERGDNFLVVIPADEYHVGPIDKSYNSGWKEAGFQRKRDGTLALGPKERTTTMFFINSAPSEDTAITLAIDAYAISWPVPSESFAQVLVPASIGDDPSVSKCPIPSDEKNTAK
jgi:hypothetical protein